MTEELKPTPIEFCQAVATVLAGLGNNYNSLLAEKRALEAEANDLMVDCGRKDEELAQAQALIANLRSLNSSLHREVQAHRRALADIRQRIVNGETLTVELAEPIQPIESVETIEETFNRR